MTYIDPLPSPFMDDNPEVWRTEPDDGTAKPAPNYPRSMIVSLNAILVVLALIFAMLGWQALQGEKTRREDKVHAEYCQVFEESGFPMPDDCP